MTVVVVGATVFECTRKTLKTCAQPKIFKYNGTYQRVEVCEMTRKVARSNSTTSSAAQIVLKSRNWVSSRSTLGISEYTIWDQALYRVSSQIEVANERILKLCDEK